MADQPSLPDLDSRERTPMLAEDSASSGKRLALVLVLLLFTASAVAAVDVWRARYVPIHRFEATAVHGLRTIARAEQQYESTYPRIGYACSLSALVGAPGQGPPSPNAAHILRNLDFMYGPYSGYGFTVAQCRRQSPDAPDKVTGYLIVAVPVTAGKTGKNGFCLEETGAITVDPTGGANCTIPYR
jgi:hypothetical protein